ncbi:MAG: formate dehydrogenase subunit gamma [Hyphomicrobiales bacterium]
MPVRSFLALMLSVLLFAASNVSANAQTADNPRASTGGAQTLQDILARQRGETVDYRFRREAIGNRQSGARTVAPLGTLGGVSDAEIYRAYRFGEAVIISTSIGPAATVVIQDGGMAWLKLRAGPLPKYGGYLLIAMLVVVALFYLLRGKILIEGEKTGETILRFKNIERLAHWGMAIPFLLLAFTGLTLLFGRVALIPLFGKEVYSPIAIAGKYVHNYVAWVFMAGLILSFVLWVWDNFPDRSDFVWLAKGGGLFTKGVHPPSGKFNAGEKLIFWAVIWFGVLSSITGLSLLFPFDLPMFAPTFQFLNDTGIPQFVGLGELDVTLAPQEEMQLSQIWHASIAFVYMAMIIAHIYLGSIGMEGALESMTRGEVEVQWAKEHHSLWYEDVVSKTRKTEDQTPAE